MLVQFRLQHDANRLGWAAFAQTGSETRAAPPLEMRLGLKVTTGLDPNSDTSVAQDALASARLVREAGEFTKRLTLGRLAEFAPGPFFLQARSV